LENLNFPHYAFSFQTEGQKKFIFDPVRKKFIPLTPEEWVRQHLVHYLVDQCGCTTSLMAVEKGLTVNGLQKRFDVLVYDNTGEAILLAECKAPDIQLSESTFLQAAVYNKSLGVSRLVITNGLELRYCQYSNNFTGYQITNDIPKYPFT
jgi:hypothetical protein